MPKLIRAPQRAVRSRLFDSARWDGYAPRDGDIVIATYPKCGTTWTQRIVGMLVFGSDAPFAVHDSSPWPDMRMRDLEETLAAAEAQTHRRFFKSHLPYDALPLYEGVKYIHVARDGRDAAMSQHNHERAYTAGALERLDAVSLGDPKFGDPLPRAGADPADYFRGWLDGPHDGWGDEGAAYFALENSYWAARHDPQLLLVHYNDLKADRDGEMRRIAAFLDIDIPEATWPALVAAADFGAMKRDGAQLMPTAHFGWEKGADSFLHRGTNRRWQGVISDADLARYEARVRERVSPSLAAWLAKGRLAAGDPRQSPD